MTKEEFNKKFRELRFELGIIAHSLGFSDTTQLFELADLIKSKQTELEEMSNRLQKKDDTRYTMTSGHVTRRYVHDVIDNESPTTDWITK